MRGVIVLGIVSGCGFSPTNQMAGDLLDAANLDPTEPPPPPCETWVPGDDAVRLCLDFEDPSLTSLARDASGHQHDAVLAGVAMKVREVGDTAQQALGVATESKVMIAESAELDATNALSFGLWVFANATPQPDTAPLGLLSNGTEYGIALQPDGDVRCTVGDQLASSNLLAAPLLTLNRWIHVACTYDGHDLRVYLNGVLSDCTAAPMVAVKRSSSGIVIGARNDGLVSSPLVGAVDNVHVYARALTALEICSLHGIPAGVCIQSCL
ncbi:MAG: LamG domain-containing protein [Kofleriaceae bacterium]